MFWLALPVVLVVGKAIYDHVTAEDSAPVPRTVLERNLSRLRRELNSHVGHRVAVFGQPGAGKSSLLLRMTDGQIAPPPVVGAQTDATNWADDSACALLCIHGLFTFVDVPGYDTEAHPTRAFELNFPFAEVDAYIFVLSNKVLAADMAIFERVARTGKPVCIARSFSENLEEAERLTAARDVRSRLSPTQKVRVFFFSNRTGEGIRPVFSWVRAQLAP